MERLTERDEDNIVCVRSYSADATDAIQDAINKLAEYEDLEEHGLLVRLPCKVGDTVYRICRRVDGRKNGHVRKVEITPRNSWFVEHCLQKGEYYLTREEAEAALREEQSK